MLEESDILHKSNDKVNNVSLYALQLKSVNYQVKLLQLLTLGCHVAF